jgi:2-keto-4-pentenoate hydratase/2-oxohepta-3-ene-1,7-dioic acid hydratase in catechol pathway
MLKFFRFVDANGDAKWGACFDAHNATVPTRGVDVSGIFPAHEIPVITADTPECVQELATTLENPRLLAAIPAPQNCVAVGMNYASHAHDVGGSEVTLFPKPCEPTLAGAPLKVEESWLLDWEIELGIVVGCDVDSIWDLTSKSLNELVAGFVLTLDMSNRTPQILTPQSSFTTSKSNTGFLPLGAFFLPMENFLGKNSDFELPPFHLLLKKNGVEMQNANSAEMRHSIHYVITKILEQKTSLHETHGGQKIPLLKTAGLRRGDLILTGTPAGTALRSPTMAQKMRLLGKSVLRTWPPSPRKVFWEEQKNSGQYLKAGDEIFASITHLGEARIKIV